VIPRQALLELALDQHADSASPRFGAGR
jgi:hypothetical protein